MFDSIFVTTRDFERLSALVEAHSNPRDLAALERLEAEIDRAELVADDRLPSDVVTMHSTVVFEDGHGHRRQAQLVFPSEADPARGKISVMAPVGAALLGLRAGLSIDLPLPGGRRSTLTVLGVLRRSEDAGELES